MGVGSYGAEISSFGRKVELYAQSSSSDSDNSQSAPIEWTDRDRAAALNTLEPTRYVEDGALTDEGQQAVEAKLKALQAKFPRQTIGLELAIQGVLIDAYNNGEINTGNGSSAESKDMLGKIAAVNQQYEAALAELRQASAPQTQPPVQVESPVRLSPDERELIVLLNKLGYSERELLDTSQFTVEIEEEGNKKEVPLKEYLSTLETREKKLPWLIQLAKLELKTKGAEAVKKQVETFLSDSEQVSEAVKARWQKATAVIDTDLTTYLSKHIEQGHALTVEAVNQAIGKLPAVKPMLTEEHTWLVSGDLYKIENEGEPLYILANTLSNTFFAQEDSLSVRLVSDTGDIVAGFSTYGGRDLSSPLMMDMDGMTMLNEEQVNFSRAPTRSSNFFGSFPASMTLNGSGSYSLADLLSMKTEDGKPYISHILVSQGSELYQLPSNDDIASAQSRIAGGAVGSVTDRLINYGSTEDPVTRALGRSPTVAEVRAGIQGADFINKMLLGGEFTDRYLPGARFDHSVLDREQFDYVIMPLSSFESVSAEGANFNEAYLQGAKLNGNFKGADFSGASLPLADLQNADFTSADLNGADLSGANLGGAALVSADMRNAILMGASIRDADFTNTKTQYIKLAGATIDAKTLATNPYLHAAALQQGASIVDSGDVVRQRDSVSDGEITALEQSLGELGPESTQIFLNGLGYSVMLSETTGDTPGRSVEIFFHQESLEPVFALYQDESFGLNERKEKSESWLAGLKQSNNPEQLSRLVALAEQMLQQRGEISLSEYFQSTFGQPTIGMVGLMQDESVNFLEQVFNEPQDNRVLRAWVKIKDHPAGQSSIILTEKLQQKIPGTKRDSLRIYFDANTLQPTFAIAIFGHGQFQVHQQNERPPSEGWLASNEYTQDPAQLERLWALANQVTQGLADQTIEEYIQEEASANDSAAAQSTDDSQATLNFGGQPTTDSLAQTPSEQGNSIVDQHKPGGAEGGQLFDITDHSTSGDYNRNPSGIKPQEKGPGLINQTVNVSPQDAKPFDQAPPETGTLQQPDQKPAMPEIRPSTIVVGNQPVEETTSSPEDPALRKIFHTLHPEVRGDMTFEVFVKLDPNTIDLLVTRSKQAAVQDATIEMHNQKAQIAQGLTTELDAVTQAQKQLTQQTLRQIQASKTQPRQSFEVVSLQSKYPAAQMIQDGSGTVGQVQQVQNNIVSTNLSGTGSSQQVGNAVNVNAADIPMISLQGKRGDVANSYTQTDSIPKYMLRNTESGVQLHVVIEKPNNELAFVKVSGINIPANAKLTHYSHSAKAWVNLPQLSASELNFINSQIQTAQQTQIIPTAPTVGSPTAPAGVPGGVSVPAVPIP